MDTKKSTTACLLTSCLLGLLGGLVPGQMDVTRNDRTGLTEVGVVTPLGRVLVRRTSHEVTEPLLHRVPQSPLLAVTWQERDGANLVPHYALSPDGQAFLPARTTSYTLKLRYAAFDPLLGEPAIPAPLRALPGSRLFIVQFWTQGLEPYRAVLREKGVEIHLFLAHHAQVVSMDPALQEELRRLSFVRAVVPFHPAYKLDEGLLLEQVMGQAEKPVKRLNILALRRGLAGQEPIASRIRALGGTVEQLSPGSFQMQATLGLLQVAELARMDAVQFIDPWAPPEPDMDIARIFHGATGIQSVGGFDGTGVRGEVADIGTDTGHPEFQVHPVIPHGGLQSASHGTSTYGQIFARGINPQATGMLPNAQGIAAVWGNWAGGSRFTHTSQLVDPSLPFRCVFQSNSGGSPLTTSYTSDSQNMDLMLFDFSRLTICQSQSNQGSQLSRAAAWGKNTVSVGGIRHENSVGTADDHWSSASIGPATDGRVKPELASFYDNIFTTALGGGYTASFGGTSGATPIVAGSFGLFYQMWHTGIFNNPVSSTVFDSAPQNTTARAFMIASATQWDWISGTATNSNIDRDKQGWGHPDLQRLYDNRNKLFYIDETDVLQDLSSSVHAVTVNPGEPFLKAALVWRDNPGTVASTQHLINNLDLKVTSPNNVIYWGNFGLTNNSSGSFGEHLWSQPGGFADTINSVENVFIQNPAPGTWLVEVIAANLNQDNHVETTALDADYALCVIGVQPTPASFFNLVLTTSGAGDLGIALSNIPLGTTQGYTLFAENAAGPLAGGPLLGITPTAVTFFLLAFPATPGGLFHWTWPSAGIFPDTPLNLPTGTVPLGFFPIDGVAVSLDAGFVLTGVTPVRRVN